MGSIFENFRSSPYFYAIFSTVMVKIYFGKKMVWATFWQFGPIVQKLIWSPCSA
jgi:hypothetical protein